MFRTYNVVHISIYNMLQISMRSTISPFVLSKALQAGVGTMKSVRRQRNGNVLEETDSRTYSAKLLALTDIGGCPVQASAHRTLNSNNSSQLSDPGSIKHVTSSATC